MGVLDSHVAFQQSAELQLSEVDVPHHVVDLFEPDILADTGDRDIHLLAIPADRLRRPLSADVNRTCHSAARFAHYVR